MFERILVLAGILISLFVVPTVYGDEYCIKKESDVYGTYYDLNSAKEGISVKFYSEKSSSETDDLAIVLLKDRFLDYWTGGRERINSQNNREVQDQSKLYADFADVYYVPADIATWAETKKNITIRARWFQYEKQKYLYLTARINKDAFIFQDGDYSGKYKIEAVFKQRNGIFEPVLRGGSINILKIENNNLIIGTMDSGYEGAGGTIIKYDGTKSVKICDWGFGV